MRPLVMTMRLMPMSIMVEHLVAALGQVAARGRHQLLLGRLVRQVDVVQAQRAAEVRLGGLAGVAHRHLGAVAAGVDLEVARVGVGQPVARVVVADVVGHELVHRRGTLDGSLP